MISFVPIINYMFLKEENSTAGESRYNSDFIIFLTAHFFNLSKIIVTFRLFLYK